MWPETPEQRLEMIRQDQLLRRLEVRRRPLPQASRSRGTGRSRSNGFSGLHLHLGRTILVIGRTLCEEDARRPDPMHS